MEGLRRLLRTHGGWLVGLCGALLCALGWYGVSGERYEARQLPYLASATIPGAALIVAGAVLVVGTRGGAAGESGAVDAELRSMVGRLYELLVEPVPDAAEQPTAAAGWVTVPGGARYHRSECSLVRGKNGVFPVDEAMARNKDLRPCRLCDPGPGPGQTTPGAAGPGAVGPEAAGVGPAGAVSPPGAAAGSTKRSETGDAGPDGPASPATGG
ncbi:hypothetical protein [Embleya scabrispora]|uniref:hypothetical protein n=1 Tax=Embleya scabrispora TaxID=159449 RepID=UPI00037BCE02|nr:hypothetical protein [Embleya scabrispora]